MQRAKFFGGFALVGAICFATLFITDTNATAQTETVIHNFSGTSDYPEAGLVADSDGNLYGVTGVGVPDCTSKCGSVYELSPSSSGWNFKLLYVFEGGGDGISPQSPLVLDAAGNLYGTTAYGGGTCPFQADSGCGTVFELSPNSSGGWTETVLHRFNHSSDGAFPITGVILDSSGSLYGTTEFAGVVNTISPSGCGTLYKLTPSGGSWSFSVLYTFAASGGCSGGVLVSDSMGNFYGTTFAGGIAKYHCRDGCGVVFKFAPSGSSWTESVLYEFTGEADGDTPFPLIRDSEGNLYGGALFGGSGACLPNGCGTLFELKPSGSSWSFSVLHNFNGNDGALPVGITHAANGNLYGATEDGGLTANRCDQGCGTVFELTSTSGGWTETLLHRFTGGSDGSQPPGSVILDASGNLYGTTLAGGTSGSGVAFEITP
ncbi:MAG: choice-of-anchor tandem repeat GloVer-containing protein [Candidatus Sulfotelmatobacter sp.]